MSYLVFARKWRPLSFSDVVGQEHVTQTLSKAIEKDRVAHAYIFSGTRGVGKTTTARILARALNCEKGPTPTPCGECESCRGIMTGSSFDVLEIDGASNNSVEDIRELRDNINYSSMGGRHRIYVIDEVHMLSKAAFNALLKTLEEPPRNVIFIFATTEPQKIPETIHSRCQRYDFRRISTECILDRLERICREESIDYDRQALLLVARKADGSMRDALSLLDQAYSFCREKMSEKEVRGVLGLVDTEIYADIMKAVAAKDEGPVLTAVQDVLTRGYDLHEFLLGFQEFIRTLLFVRIPSVFESRRVDLQNDAVDQLAELSRSFAEGDLLRMAEMLRKAEQDLRWSAFPRFLVELTLLKLVRMDHSVTIEQVLAAVEGKGGESTAGGLGGAVSRHRSVITEKKNDTIAKSPAPPVDVPESNGQNQGASEQVTAIEEQAPRIVSMRGEDETPESFETPTVTLTEKLDTAVLWPKFIETLMNDRPNLGTFLSMGYVASTTEESIDLRFGTNLKFQFSEVTRKQNRDTIEKRLNTFAGRPLELHISLAREDQKTPVKTVNPDEMKARRMSPSLVDDMAGEPIIENVMKVFNGEVI
ncbi:MAG: DNA polymerase III subunit gamma/tau [Chitinivibrionales bacterium]|nr:DNA polymerase III subunit gamma/tau [Chitinivibrionales bacterium]MBD3358866.1 DNA polymerase III subunit gamma/tau [Chitinivibrionales bacterium]